MPGVVHAIGNAFRGADRALGGWLPLPPGLDAQQPPVRELLDAAGSVVPFLGGQLQKAIGRYAERKMSSLPEEQASREQRLVRRTFNQSFGDGLTVAPPPPTKGSTGLTSDRMLNFLTGGPVLNVPSADAMDRYRARVQGFGVDIRPTVSGHDKFDPGGQLETGPSGVSGRDVVHLGRNSPGWIAAHELGHLRDIRLENPDNPFVKNTLARYREDLEALRVRGVRDVSLSQAVRNSRTRAATLPALGLMSSQGRDRNLLQAAAEGALEGLATQAATLRNEFAADRYGKPIAQKAGVPWDSKLNLAAKGTYVTGAALPGAAFNVIGELVNRGIEAAGDLASEYVVEPLARRMRGGDSPVEASLRKYGYDPSTHRVRSDLRGGLEVVNRRGS